MTDTPWQGDASSLVDAFRAGERSPAEELDASLAAIDASDLNAFSHLDPTWAHRAAANADITKPFGGVPVGIKQLEPVEGWPHTEASLVFADRIAEYTAVNVQRLLDNGGVTPVGQTTASEFGGLNVSVTKINGVTHNPWRHGHTVGGSSTGSSAAVAGGLVSLASGGDGGGSIRIPAGYTGLLGMKGTFGRIPRSPNAYMRPNTVVLGCLARSVRDAARYYDVCAGPDYADPSSLPAHPSFEKGLESHDLKGLRVAIVPTFSGVELEPGVEENLLSHAEAMIDAAGMKRVEVPLELPSLAAQWMMGNMATLLPDLAEHWPQCASLLTDEIALGLFLSKTLYNLDTAAKAEVQRIQADEAMAEAFRNCDLIVSATNPGPAFNAEWSTSSPEPPVVSSIKGSAMGRGALRGLLGGVRLATAVASGLPNAMIEFANERFPDFVAMGGLTMLANLYGNPAVSIPAGTVNGLPVGMQVMAPHHHDALLFDVARSVELNNPWPLVAPTVSAPVSA
ncbi:MAG TPA: amidase [Acidimicrobiales bacterium]|nr:amidase [Acidimicrobiales bacterium]